ncbi:MAG: type IV pilus modification protein PilV [Pseudomonadales bacterium]|nr:type IV pilus modification protein PilV [Pseudomonadales bacterium]NRA18205.1 type IV pilus modification protein PilV [Oceanospirillaceae bacterium]
MLNSNRFGCLQCGSGLIEILVTVLVVSVGLLGMASLQLKSMSLNHTAYQRLQAVNLAYEMADSIFVNSTEAAAGEYTLTLADNSSNASDNTSVAFSDVTEWIAAASRRLPAGDIAIDAPQVMAAAANVAVYKITVCWLDKNANLALPNDCGAADRGLFSFSASSRL